MLLLPPVGGLGWMGGGVGRGANFDEKKEKFDTKNRPTPEIWAFRCASAKRQNQAPCAGLPSSIKDTPMNLQKLTGPCHCRVPVLI